SRSVVVTVSVVVCVVVVVPPPLPATTMIAISRPTITATRQAIRSRMLPCGRPPEGPPRPPSPRPPPSRPRPPPLPRRPSSSGLRMIRVGSSCIGSAFGAEDRVEDRLGVLALESVSQPRRDLLPARAGYRHLGCQQACPGRRAAAASLEA